MKVDFRNYVESRLETKIADSIWYKYKNFKKYKDSYLKNYLEMLIKYYLEAMVIDGYTLEKVQSAVNISWVLGWLKENIISIIRHIVSCVILFLVFRPWKLNDGYSFTLILLAISVITFPITIAFDKT